MITWEDTINLIVDMFDINQNELADLLGVSKFALSKLKTGKQSPPFTTDTVFSIVFDPSNPKSPAQKDTPDSLLETLKIVIENPKYVEIQNAMRDSWDDTDYKIFVTRLLSRTRKGVKKDVVPSSEAYPVPMIEESFAESAPVPWNSSQIGSADMPNTRNLSIRSIFLPHADKACCYYCKFWNGDRETIGAYLTSTYGPCLKYSREKKLSSDTACKDFIRRTKLPMEW